MLAWMKGETEVWIVPEWRCVTS